MKLKVKTQDDRMYSLDVNPKIHIRQLKDEVHSLNSSIDSNKYRILFQGKFLDDEDSLESAGIEDGHTLLLVPRPPQSRQNQNNTSTSTSTSNTPLYNTSKPQCSEGNATGDRQNAPTDDDLDVMEQQPVFDHVVDVQECDMSEPVLGFVVGFLLGPIAGLCLIENTLSRQLRAGMLIGIIFEVVFALFKMSTHIPKGV